MGYYLNSKSPAAAYRKSVESTYFVDKTAMLEELFSVMGTDDANICLTRPRRFGKTVVANMIAAFFGKGCDTSDIFDRLSISTSANYHKYLNKSSLIYINFSKMPENCRNYEQYITRITARMKRELLAEYPDVLSDEEDAVWDILADVYEIYGEQFVFVIDEWDCIFHKEFTTEDDRKAFIEFLANLLKDQSYTKLTYMTGVLPIACAACMEAPNQSAPDGLTSWASIVKYSSGSTINNFREYDMATKKKYGEYFGFTESEVAMLYQRYLKAEMDPSVSLDSLKKWYDGYQSASGERLYNPRSVVYALSNNQIADYWTASGSYMEISDYIVDDVDGVKEAIVSMVEGNSIPLVMEAQAATAWKWDTKDEILSAMVVYGFLTYDEGAESVRIPNRELMDEFEGVIKR